MSKETVLTAVIWIMLFVASTVLMIWQINTYGWLPEPNSTIAPTVDWLFGFVMIVSYILFGGVVAGVIFFVWRFQRRGSGYRPPHIKENKFLEAAWVIGPAILVLIVFNWGFQGYLKAAVAPPNAYEIMVRGKQWLWEFDYPNGKTSTSELVVPVNRPIKLTMSSEDVIHSFFIPAFRVKFDVLPNNYTSLWFEATREGDYQAFCTEYCGTTHSGMLAMVKVVPQQAFDQWLQAGGEDVPLPELGARLYTQQICNTCHSLDGAQGVGPSFQGLFGRQETMVDGSTVTVDENYIRQSILEPATRLVEGYPPVMPASYTGLTEREISALIEFIKQQQ